MRRPMTLDVDARLQRAQRLSLIGELSDAISRAASEAEFYRIAARHTPLIFPSVERCSVALLEPGGQEMEIFALEGSVGSIPVGKHLPVQGTMIGQVVRDRRVVLIDGEAFQKSELIDVRMLRDLGMGATMDAPLIIAGDVFGTLNTAARSPEAYGTEDAELLQLVASLIGAGVRHWRLVAELREALAASERHAAELAAARDAAEAANRAKSAFLANMSHELRTPLSAILGFAQLMCRDSSVTPSQRERLEIISRSGEHLLSLINSVLEMSKIESSVVTIQPADIDLQGLLDEVVQMFEARAAHKQLRLQLSAEGAPRHVRSDESKLRQVLINLVGNAVKFTAEGEVWLRAGLGGDRLWLAVADTGPGLSAEEMGALFQPFVQGAAGRRAREGTGLGLTIAKKFVELLGGTLTVESEPGQGSTFRIDLPFVPGSETARPEKARPQPVVGLAGDRPPPRLLVVDDHDLNRRALVDLLRSVGFDVRDAAGGRQGLALWSEWKPDMIFLDMRMPEVDGLTVARELRGSPEGRSTVIVALTASAFEEERTEILAAGCDEFLRKPFREADLFEIIARRLPVELVYGDGQPARIPSSPGRQSLALLSAELRAELHAAASQADAERVERVVARFAKEHPELAGQLSELVRDFRFDEILRLAR